MDNVAVSAVYTACNCINCGIGSRHLSHAGRACCDDCTACNNKLLTIVKRAVCPALRTVYDNHTIVDIGCAVDIDAVTACLDADITAVDCQRITAVTHHKPVSAALARGILHILLSRNIACRIDCIVRRVDIDNAIVYENVAAFKTFVAVCDIDIAAVEHKASVTVEAIVL